MIGYGDVHVYDISGQPPYVRQTLRTTGGDAIVISGLAYDSVIGKIVAWNGGSTAYIRDLDQRSWSIQD